MVRLFVAALFILFACSTALAETYDIRVTWPTRLRASYSLDSRIVEVALAGDVLQVVGRFNRWLKIDRNGKTVWMADWVDYVRLDEERASRKATSSEGAREPSDIDNCCFVNRQCATDQEWVDGYWAYQRNECPAQPRPGTSSAPVAGHAISIQGSPLFINHISEALNLLRTRSPKWYNYVISGANAIVQDNGIFGGGLAGLLTRTVLLPPYGYLITTSDDDFNVANVASTLVHEACHIHRHDAGHPYTPYTNIAEELVCIEQEKAMLRETVEPHLQGLHGIIAIAHCAGDLTNHPRCRFVRENCEWAADGQLIDCPAIGLTEALDR